MPPRAELRPIVRCVSRPADDTVVHPRLAHFTRASGEDWVAEEAPLALRVWGEPFVTTMRTPGDDRDLLLGWLYHEGLLRKPSDLSSLAPCHTSDGSSNGDVYDLIPAAPMEQRLKARDPALCARTLHTSCGLCGRQTITDILARTPRLEHTQVWSASCIHTLLSACSAQQPLFQQTGCTHGASMGDLEGGVLQTREDVGRHNAVDKLTGWLLRSGQLPVGADKALVVSSRASLEIVHKALVAGFSAVFSLSAPTSLAIDLARDAGILLAGFLRAGRFNVYTEHERVVEGAP